MDLAIASVNIVCTLIGSYTDIRTQKIPNWLTLGLVSFNLAMGLTMVLILNTLTARIMILSFIIGISLAFLSYCLKIWAPGDAKLFGAAFFGLCLALRNIINPFNILLNVMLVPFILVLFEGLFRTTFRRKINTIRKLMRQELLKTVIFINIFAGIGFRIISVFPEVVGQFELLIIYFVLLFLLGKGISKVYERYTEYVYIIAFVAMIHNVLLFPITRWMFIGVLIFAAMMVQFIKSVDRNIFYVDVHSSDMNRADLSPTEVVENAEEGQDYVKRTMVFGPYISLGVILTMLLQGQNVVVYLLRYYRSS